MRNLLLEWKVDFVFRKQDTYDVPLSGKVVKTRVDRFYFSDDELIRWINETGNKLRGAIVNTVRDKPITSAAPGALPKGALSGTRD